MGKNNSGPIILVAIVLAAVGIFYFSQNPSALMGSPIKPATWGAPEGAPGPIEGGTPEVEPAGEREPALVRDVSMIGQEIESPTPEDNLTGEIEEMDAFTSGLTIENGSF